jgi:hypothetical protein
LVLSLASLASLACRHRDGRVARLSHNNANQSAAFTVFIAIANYLQ